MFVPNVLVSDPDDVADELADGVLEACDWPHHFGNRVNLGKITGSDQLGRRQTRLFHFSALKIALLLFYNITSTGSNGIHK